ncbi:MAG: translation initiation factor IF-3 [Candidatus Sumerlaeota bacterium]
MRSPNRYRKRQEAEYQMNEDIRAPQVRLVGEDGDKIGIVPLEKALEMAGEAGVDLVEVAPQADPPVCRIMDYNKLQYEKQRKMKEARKNQRSTDTKEVKLRPNIDEHDYQTKLNHLREFLQKGMKCKISLQFRAREMRRYDVGRQVVQRMMSDVKDIATVESSQLGHGRMISAFLSPSKDVLQEVERQHRKEVEQRKEEQERKLARKAEKN